MSAAGEGRPGALARLLGVVGVVTAGTGALQIAAPRWVLRLLGAETTRATTQLFATVGMFMVVVGSLLTRTVRRDRPDPDVIAWAGLQKLGAATAVTVGVRRAVFGPVALLVAVTDLGTAALLAAFWRRMSARRGDAAGAPADDASGSGSVGGSGGPPRHPAAGGGPSWPEGDLG